MIDEKLARHITRVSFHKGIVEVLDKMEEAMIEGISLRESLVFMREESKKKLKEIGEVIP